MIQGDNRRFISRHHVVIYSRHYSCCCKIRFGRYIGKCHLSHDLCVVITSTTAPFVRWTYGKEIDIILMNAAYLLGNSAVSISGRSRVRYPEIFRTVNPESRTEIL